MTDAQAHNDATPQPAEDPRLALVAKDVHIEYELVTDRRSGLRARIVSGEGPKTTVVHAVKGISFTLAEGDAVAFIGSNGSGKSTLLASFAGILPLASGEIWVREVPKLLGVGATLMPEISGRRNVNIGCLALGMTPEQVEETSQSVIDFADIGEAIDRPMRTYSSGMRARIQFAIATSVKPRILLIDEALAVGDQEFKNKCKRRIEDLRDSAGALVLVSHSPGDIRDMCKTAVWIDQGKIVDHGTVDEVLAHYSKK
jgi:teichoic acid transport system ATP-binding protein